MIHFRDRIKIRKLHCKEESDLPKRGYNYVYMGFDNPHFTSGKSYKVVEYDIDNYKKYGHLVWVASEEKRVTNDEDDCYPMNLKKFKANFWEKEEIVDDYYPFNLSNGGFYSK
ncbi:hypothetical protein [Bacillus sp. Marseille-P3800]|uniref:hypothetical protein n=1 Tax=Bacillus sp. Marseille-P3800 TaxID=2014782 RepID=UPI000C06BD53|nr:hypothetical protein [Bacillus sp. Marseille-P3800]